MVGILQKRMAREERKIARAEEEGRRDRVERGRKRKGGRGREEEVRRAGVGMQKSAW